MLQSHKNAQNVTSCTFHQIVLKNTKEKSVAGAGNAQNVIYIKDEMVFLKLNRKLKINIFVGKEIVIIAEKKEKSNIFAH